MSTKKNKLQITNFQKSFKNFLFLVFGVFFKGYFKLFHVSNVHKLNIHMHCFYKSIRFRQHTCVILFVRQSYLRINGVFQQDDGFEHIIVDYNKLGVDRSTISGTGHLTTNMQLTKSPYIVFMIIANPAYTALKGQYTIVQHEITKITSLNNTNNINLYGYFCIHERIHCKGRASNTAIFFFFKDIKNFKCCGTCKMMPLFGIQSCCI